MLKRLSALPKVKVSEEQNELSNKLGRTGQIDMNMRKKNMLCAKFH